MPPHRSHKTDLPPPPRRCVRPDRPTTFAQHPNRLIRAFQMLLQARRFLPPLHDDNFARHHCPP